MIEELQQRDEERQNLEILVKNLEKEVERETS